MSLTIVGANTPASLNFHQLNSVNRRARKSLQALSSGKRINSLEDDASGFSLARGLEAHRRSVAMAIENMSTAENVLEIASNGYKHVMDLLLRIKEYVVRGADDTVNGQARPAIEKYIEALKDEIDSIVTDTTFQGLKLIDGGFTSRRFQTGARPGDYLDVNLPAVDSATLNLDAIDLTNSLTGTASLQIVDDAITEVNEAMQDAGEYAIRMKFKKANLRRMFVGTEATRSQIEDADFAKQYASLTKYQILQQLGAQTLQQSIAAPQLVLTLIR